MTCMARFPSSRETISWPGIELQTTPCSLSTSPLPSGSLRSSRTKLQCSSRHLETSSCPQSLLGTLGKAFFANGGCRLYLQNYTKYDIMCHQFSLSCSTLIVNRNVVSPTLMPTQHYLSFLVKFGGLWIYNVAIIVTYHAIFHPTINHP